MEFQDDVGLFRNSEMGAVDNEGDGFVDGVVQFLGEVVVGAFGHGGHFFEALPLRRVKWMLKWVVCTPAIRTGRKRSCSCRREEGLRREEDGGQDQAAPKIHRTTVSADFAGGRPRAGCLEGVHPSKKAETKS